MKYWEKLKDYIARKSNLYCDMVRSSGQYREIFEMKIGSLEGKLDEANEKIGSLNFVLKNRDGEIEGLRKEVDAFVYAEENLGMGDLLRTFVNVNKGYAHLTDEGKIAEIHGPLIEDSKFLGQNPEILRHKVYESLMEETDAEKFGLFILGTSSNENPRASKFWLPAKLKVSIERNPIYVKIDGDVGRDEKGKVRSYVVEMSLISESKYEKLKKQLEDDVERENYKNVGGMHIVRGYKPDEGLEGLKPQTS